MISRPYFGPYAGIIQIRWYGYFSAFAWKGTPSRVLQKQVKTDIQCYLMAIVALRKEVVNNYCIFNQALN